MSLLLLKWFLSAAAAAGTAAPTDPAQEVVLRNGTKFSGRVLSSDDEVVSFEFIENGQEGTLTLRRDQVDPHSWYVLRARAIPDRAPEHLRLARFCSENGLYFQAERELGRVLELDPSAASNVEHEILRARAGAAEKLLELAVLAFEKDDIDRAEKLLATVITRYDVTEAADRARQLVERVAARKIELERVAVAERQAKAEAAAEARRVALLEPAEKQLDAARRKNLDALKDKNLSRAQGGFVAAVKSYERGLTELDRLAKAQGNDGELRGRIEALRTVAVSEAIEVHVSMGSTLLVRGAYTQALSHANEALAMDTHNRYAKEFRARVEIASAEASRSRFGARTSAIH
jgi:tetratricopeptide (TPR) repeat protein